MVGKARDRIATDTSPEARSSGARLPTPRHLAWLLVQPASAENAVATAIVARVEQDKTTRAVATLARCFTALVRASGTDRTPSPSRNMAMELDTWLAEAHACEASAIATFAAGLKAVGAAVRAALTEPWRSGQAEGQINRPKLVKQQSYGRASLDLLRRRMALAT